jgi:hypothetical protein
MEPDQECPICLLSLNNNPSITVSCCNKQFHTICYTKCMMSKLVCPMCRANQSVTTETIITINPIIPVIPVRHLIVQDSSCKAFLYKILTTVFVCGLVVICTLPKWS